MSASVLHENISVWVLSSNKCPVHVAEKKDEKLQKYIKN